MSFNHIPMNASCPLCNEKLQQADPLFQEIFISLKKIFPDCHISWSFRDESDQNLFFKEGKTKVQWPDSKHNILKNGSPCSRALDLFKLTKDNIALFDREYYRKISTYLIKNLIPVEWAGNWIKFKETDHFQLIDDDVGT